MHQQQPRVEFEKGRPDPGENDREPTAGEEPRKKERRSDERKGGPVEPLKVRAPVNEEDESRERRRERMDPDAPSCVARSSGRQCADRKVEAEQKKREIEKGKVPGEGRCVFPGRRNLREQAQRDGRRDEKKPGRGRSTARDCRGDDRNERGDAEGDSDIVGFERAQQNPPPAKQKGRSDPAGRDGCRRKERRRRGGQKTGRRKRDRRR